MPDVTRTEQSPEHRPSKTYGYLLARCGEILRVDQLKPEDDFFGVGGDSLDALEICEMLGRELGREVELEAVLRSRSFAEMLEAVAK
jgi:acyl carrier protein